MPLESMMSDNDTMNGKSHETDFYSTREVAEILGFSINGMLHMLRRGEIPCVKIGKQYRIRKNFVDRMEWNVKPEDE